MNGMYWFKKNRTVLTVIATLPLLSLISWSIYVSFMPSLVNSYLD